MAYNHGREDRKWRIWKEAEEKLLRECGVDEATIEQIRMADRADFNSNRRFYRWTNDVAEYLEDMAGRERQAEVGTVAELLEESCFVSFDKELNDLPGFYSGGAIIVGYEEDKPIACVAIKKISDETCEGKRLFIRPEYRGKGYARIMLKAMTDKAFELGFKELIFTTKPEVMRIGYK